MTTDSARRFIIAYDIPSDARRTRVAKLLSSYGDRIQYSVFLVDAKPAKLVRLRGVLVRQLVLDEDSVLFCDLGTHRDGALRRISHLGLARTITDDNSFVI